MASASAQYYCLARHRRRPEGGAAPLFFGVAWLDPRGVRGVDPDLVRTRGGAQGLHSRGLVGVGKAAEELALRRGRDLCHVILGRLRILLTFFADAGAEGYRYGELGRSVGMRPSLLKTGMAVAISSPSA